MGAPPKQNSGESDIDADLASTRNYVRQCDVADRHEMFDFDRL
jgi:hypothetical protein